MVVTPLGMYLYDYISPSDVTAYITLRATVRNNIPAGCRSVLPNMNLAARPMMTAAKTIL